MGRGGNYPECPVMRLGSEIRFCGRGGLDFDSLGDLFLENLSKALNAPIF